ncbi:MAG TPA: diguanylate cyclase, partial [Thermoanaerobaculia bacterium]|nr:diguanylate cyclase [Thermoanaerobaculia bacterium]
WALGSVLGGLLLLRPDGMVDQMIDTTVGLADDYVTGMAMDREGSLWLSLNNSLARVEVASPLSVLDRRSGLQGSVYHMTRHRGDLWAATAAGVFTIEPGGTGGAASPERPSTARMRHVPGLPPAGWSLLSAGEDLLAATAAGVYRIRGGLPRLIEGTDQRTAYTLTASRFDPERVWVGTSEGLYAIRRDGPEWRYEGGVEGLEDEVRSVVEGDAGILWCGTSLGGVVRVEVPAGWPARRATVRGIPGDGAINVFRIAGRILAVRDKQVLRLDEAKGVLVEDPALAGLAGHGVVYHLTEDAQGNLWMNTNPLSVGLRRGSGWPELRSLVEVPARSVETIFAEPDGTVWLAGNDGLYRYAGISRSPAPPLPAPRLASVTAGGERLFGGAPGIAPQAPELAANVRRLRIELAPLSFRAGLRYQTRLDPEDTDWNAPSTEPFAELTRLPPGRYAFRARTVGPSGEVGPESAWSFRVLPPWYRTPWALALWTGAAFLGIWAYVRRRGHALRHRATLLETRVNEQTLELRRTVEELSRAHTELAAANVRLEELSLQDALTGIANRRRLQQMLEDEWSRARRHTLPVAFILLDLDYFKLLNDTRGHGEGDLCLQTVARFLAGTIERTGDLAARYGGEEFAILLPETGLAGALIVAEQLREGIESLAFPHLTSPHGRVTASFGVAAVSPAPGQSPDVLIEAADLALYRAKTEGRNRVRAGNVDGETADLEIVAR